MLEILSCDIKIEVIDIMSSIFSDFENDTQDITKIMSLSLESLTGMQLAAVAARLMHYVASNNEHETISQKCTRLSRTIAEGDLLLFECDKVVIGDFLEFVSSDGDSPKADSIHKHITSSDITGGEVALTTIFALSNIIAKEKKLTYQEILYHIASNEWSPLER